MPEKRMIQVYLVYMSKYGNWTMQFLFFAFLSSFLLFFVVPLLFAMQSSNSVCLIVLEVIYFYVYLTIEQI